MKSLVPADRTSAAGGLRLAGTALNEHARAEVLAFPPRHLAGLPVATRFALKMTDFAHVIGWSSELDSVSRTGVWFDAGEVEAIAIAAQAERLWPADLKGFCLRKLHDPSFRVTPQLALAGAQPMDDPPWSLARVLRWLDLELSGIDLATRDAELPPSSRESAAA